MTKAQVEVALRLLEHGHFIPLQRKIELTDAVQKWCEEPHEEKPAVDGTLLAKPISGLGLSARVRNALDYMSIRTIGDLVAKTDIELLSIRNFGLTSLHEVQSELAKIGLGIREREPLPEDVVT